MALAFDLEDLVELMAVGPLMIHALIPASVLYLRCVFGNFSSKKKTVSFVLCTIHRSRTVDAGVPQVQAWPPRGPSEKPRTERTVRKLQKLRKVAGLFPFQCSSDRSRRTPPLPLARLPFGRWSYVVRISLQSSKRSIVFCASESCNIQTETFYELLHW